MEGGGRGQSVSPLTAKKIAKNQEENGKKREEIRKRRKNQEEKAKIEKVLSLCPSRQMVLATLLVLEIALHFLAVLYMYFRMNIFAVKKSEHDTIANLATLKEYSVILTTSFYDMNQKILI